MRRKSFRRLRISLRHRWIAGESISYLRVSLFRSVGVGFSSSLSAFSVSTCAAHAPDREIRERRFPNGQNSNRIRRHKFVLSSSSSRQKRLLNSNSFPPNENNTTTRLSLSLSLSLSLLRSHRRTCANCVLCVRFSLSNVRDKKCSFPPPKKEGPKLLFRVYTKP